MNSELSISLVIGLVVLLVLLFRDFRAKVFRPSNSARYYLALFLFILINIFFYVGLCGIFLDIGSAADILNGRAPDVQEVSGLRLLQPVLIALLYFGTGIAKFTVGGKEIDFYQILLNAFQDLLKITVVKEEEIESKIEKVSLEYKALKEEIDHWREKAKDNKWDRLDNDWIRIIEEIEALDERADYLKGLKSKLIDPVNIDHVREDINTRIEENRETKVKRIKDYIKKFVWKNFNAQSDIEFFLKHLGVTLNPHPVKPNPVLRCTVICLMFGLLVGPIQGILLQGNVVIFGWIGAISVGVFGFIFSFARTAKKNARDLLLRAILSGISAGVAGHLVFMALVSLHRSGDLSGIDYYQLYFGLEFGGVLGVLIYYFRTHLIKFTSMARYFLLSFAGGSVFVLLAYLNKMNENDAFNGSAIIFVLYMFFFGVIVVSGLAFGLAIFDEESSAGEQFTHRGEAVHGPR